MLKKSINKPVRKFNLFRAKIRTRHPTHGILREKLILLPFKSVVRLGSTTNVPDTISNGGNRIELNTTTAIGNSASKFKMKDCFKEANVKTAEFYKVKEVKDNLDTWEVYPLVAKINFGSRGRGMKKIDNKEQLSAFLNTDTIGYYFEKFYNYNREYRIHISAEGYFYSCRKMVKSDTPDNQKWFRNDLNSVWIIEENENFDKPTNWNTIVDECVKALNSVGLDMGACDVRVQSSKNKKDKFREEPDFIIVEINSAPSFGEITAVKYLEEIPKILKRKYELNNQ